MKAVLLWLSIDLGRIAGLLRKETEMSGTDSRQFYLRRERQERALAENAASPAIGKIHTAMAEIYALRAGQAADPSVARGIPPGNRSH